MNICTVCMKNSRRNKNLSFFSYPMDDKRRNEWLKRAGREDLIWLLNDKRTRRNGYKICEEHFEKSCIKYAKNGRYRYLVDNAYPTINMPSDLNRESETEFTIDHKNWISETKIVDIVTTTKTIETKHVQSHISKKRKQTQQPCAAKEAGCDLEKISKSEFLKLCDKFMTQRMSEIIKRDIVLKETSEEIDPADPKNASSSKSGKTEVNGKYVDDDFHEREKRRDECELFGLLLAQKLLHFSDEHRLTLMNDIDNLVMESAVISYEDTMDRPMEYEVHDEDPTDVQIVEKYEVQSDDQSVVQIVEEYEVKSDDPSVVQIVEENQQTFDLESAVMSDQDTMDDPMEFEMHNEDPTEVQIVEEYEVQSDDPTVVQKVEDNQTFDLEIKVEVVDPLLKNTFD